MTKKTRTEIVRDSQAKAAEQGAERLTLTLYGEDAERWRRRLATYSGHGAKMRAFRDALIAAEQGAEPTPEQALDILARAIRR
jgi:hypothetical protein